MAGVPGAQRVSPDMLMEAMDAVTDGVVIVDTDSRIVYLNEAYTHILNVKRKKVLYRRMAEIEPGAVILDTLMDISPGCISSLRYGHGERRFSSILHLFLKKVSFVVPCRCSKILQKLR